MFMTPYNYYLPVVLLILIGGYIVNFIIEQLDIAYAPPVLPRELEGYYDAEKYQKSQSYLKRRSASALSKTPSLLAVSLFLFWPAGLI